MKSWKILMLALVLSILSPLSSEAKTGITGGPYENLALTGQIVNLKLTGYPTGSGFYIIQCKRVNGDARPQICNTNSQLWISTALGADYLPTTDIQFRPTAVFTYGNQTVNCVNTPCGIFIRLDHKASADRSEDQVIPITFVGNTIPNPNSDVIRAYVNSRELSNMKAISVQNQSVFRIEASAKSGATLTFSTISTTCTLSGNQVTILQGSGFCEVDVYSPGNTQYSAITNHYQFKLVPGYSTLSIPTRVRPGTSITLPATTKFGAKISYETSNSTNCTLKTTQTSSVLTFNKVGACNVKATAPAMTDSYVALRQNINFKIRS